MARGARLAKARKAKGLTQKDVAKILGVSLGTVGGWEVGDHGIRGHRLGEVARVYSVDVAELVA